MKIFRLFLLLGALCVGAALFSGCSDKDKGDNDFRDDVSAILGTWMATSNDGRVCYGFTLQANGVGAEFEYLREDPDPEASWSIRYTYDPNNGILTIRGDGYKEVYKIISLIGAQMICELDDGGRHVFTRIG